MASHDGDLGKLVHDMFGGPSARESSPARVREDRPPSWVRSFSPVLLPVAVVVVLVWWAPNLLVTPRAAEFWDSAPALGAALLGVRPWLIGAVVAAAVVDVVRSTRRRHQRVFAVVVEQTTRHIPKSIRLSPITSRHSTKHATITVPAGSVVDEKKLTALRTAVAALLTGPPPEVRRRAQLSRWANSLSKGRLDRWTRNRASAYESVGEWEYRTSFVAARAQIMVARYRVEDDLRSERHRMLADLLGDGKVLQDVSVTVAARDEDGDDVGFLIRYKQTLSTGLDANRMKLTESLLAALGTHESGQLWRIDWEKAEPVITVSLRAPLPTMVMHCLAMPPAMLPAPPLDTRGIGPQDLEWPSSIEADRNEEPSWLRKTSRPVGRRLHVPYATCETGGGLTEAFWNISDRSSAPHMLVVGPTGGGKTVLLTTLITELALRGVPSILVDPKRIELHQFIGYPGVPAVVFDALRSALLIEALHAEMMARTKYMVKHRIKPKNMPLLVVVLDEFFILSAAWTHLAKNGSEMEKETIKRADPLGKIGQLVALARSTGIRLAVGVQRPDAQLFGKDSGGVRDNFKSRASLSRMSSDGNYMVWADSNVGRDIDSSIPGRATVTDPSGDPALGQVWFTPTVDTHPAARADMSADEVAAVDSLMPAADAPVYCFSAELPVFIADEQVLIEMMGDDVHEPIAITGVSARADIEKRYALADSIADGVAAASLTPGMSIVLDVPGQQPRVAEVLDVEIVRPAVRDERTRVVTDEGEVRVQVAADTDGPRAAIDVVTYTALDTVALPTPELPPA